MNYDVGVFIGSKCLEKADWCSLKIRGGEMESLDRRRTKIEVAHLSECEFEWQEEAWHVREPLVQTDSHPRTAVRAQVERRPQAHGGYQWLDLIPGCFF